MKFKFSIVVQLLIVMMLASVMMFAFTMTASAGPLDGVWDTVKGWGGAVGWKAAAAGLTTLLLIGGVYTRAIWLSGVLLAFGTILAAVGGFINWMGVVLQDGKIDDTELKQAKPQWQATLKTIRDAWASIRGKPANA